MDVCSALLLGSLFRVMLWDLIITWVNISGGQSSHIGLNVHCLTIFSIVYQSWVGLDTILYALNILCVLQILRALSPFQFKTLFNNLFSWKIQFKNRLKNLSLALFISTKYSFNQKTRVSKTTRRHRGRLFLRSTQMFLCDCQSSRVWSTIFFDDLFGRLTCSRALRFANLSCKSTGPSIIGSSPRRASCLLLDHLFVTASSFTSSMSLTHTVKIH